MLYEFKRKLCSNSHNTFCTTEKDLEDYKRICFIPKDYIKFRGPGIYDRKGNYHQKLRDSEGTFWIDEYYTELEMISKIIDNKK